ncbi:MAG: hypothetical protein IJ358_00795 [Clostridia bacterium]|nr:hypothetical protein [Clostridia bacterium]
MERKPISANLESLQDFGYDIIKTYADVTANEQALIYWCLQYGDTIEVVQPIGTREEIKKKIDIIYKRYN